MSKTNNVIELNGKCYDVVTGALLAQPASSPQHVVKMKHVVVVKKPRFDIAAPVKPTASTAMPPQTAKPAISRMLKPLAAHKPARSNTLMRHAVKAPHIAAKPNYKTQGSLDIIASKTPQTLPEVTPKLSSSQISPARLQHANRTRHSDMVRRFAPHQTPVRGRQLGQAPVAARTASAPAVAAAPVAPPLRASAASSFPGSSAASQALFTSALTAASSHEQPAPRQSRLHRLKHPGRSRRRAFKVAGIGVAVLALAAVIGYFNQSAIRLQVASIHAGFHAKLPGYKPVGYDVHKLQAGSGAVMVAYKGPDNNGFTVNQQKSNWDSATLLDNYVATSDQSYHAYQANGRIVYVYGKGQATWVNGGVWYRLSGQSLSDDQMIKVASTM